MELQIVKIEKEGNMEMVVLKATDECNLGDFIVLDFTYEDDELSNLNRHTYIFPNQNVKINDYVLLYTGKGGRDSYPNRGGSTTWEFHWGLDINVWNSEGDEVMLVKMAEIQRYPY